MLKIKHRFCLKLAKLFISSGDAKNCVSYLNINKLGVTFFNKVKHISGTKHQT